MSMESFREKPELTALPEVQHLEISGTESYRQVWSLILATPSSTPQIPGRLHQRQAHCDYGRIYGPNRRYVRQGTDLWDRLHDGVCTTGILNDALGVYEPAACQTLGLPHFYASHHKLLRAYERLQ